MENILEIGSTYDIVYSTGKYDIEYATNVKCLKHTPLNYRIEWPDGTTSLVGKDSILKLKQNA